MSTSDVDGIIDGDGDGYSTDGSLGGKKDCNDSNRNISPAATEVCDGRDNNCDGRIDELLPTKTYYKDVDADRYGSATNSKQICKAIAGYVPNNTDCNDADKSISPIASEICDGLDNNCSGGIDEGLSIATYYKDADGDGFGSGEAVESCGGAGYVANNTDCDDADATITTTHTYYMDLDGDGHGSLTRSLTGCFATADEATNTPTAEGGAGGVKHIDGPPSDCNDYHAYSYEGAEEVCDGVDNDCVDGIDNGFGTVTLYLDWDKDGFGSPAASAETCLERGYYASESGNYPDGTPAAIKVTGDRQLDYVADNTDCNDGDKTIHTECDAVDDCTAAGAEEACNTYTVPNTIATCDGDTDATNVTDVTADLNEWLETVPDGTETAPSIVNLNGNCLAVKGTVELYNRYNITIDGDINGSDAGTIKSIDYKTCYFCDESHQQEGAERYTGSGTPGNADYDAAMAKVQADPEDASFKGRAQFSVEHGAGIIIQNLTIEGTLSRTKTNGTAIGTDRAVNNFYQGPREWDDNLTLMGPKNVTIDNVHFKNAWGDAVMLSGTNSSPVSYTGINYYATDVTIKNSFVDGTGRMALGCVGCFNFVVQDSDLRNAGYALIDVEIESNDNNSHGDISLIRNTIGPFKSALLTAATGQASDSTLGPFVLQDNVQEELHFENDKVLYAGISPAVDNTSFDFFGSSPVIVLGHENVPVLGVTITGNTFLSPGNAIQVSGATDVLIDNNTLKMYSANAVQFKNVTNAQITNNSFTGAMGVVWFEGEAASGTTCENNTTIGSVQTGSFFDQRYKTGTSYDLEGCTTWECEDWNADGVVDYTDC